jgi:hypothetical protein
VLYVSPPKAGGVGGVGGVGGLAAGAGGGSAGGFAEPGGAARLSSHCVAPNGFGLPPPEAPWLSSRSLSQAGASFRAGPSLIEG